MTNIYGDTGEALTTSINSWGLSAIVSSIQLNSDGLWIHLDNTAAITLTIANEQEIQDGLDVKNNGYRFGAQRVTWEIETLANTKGFYWMRKLTDRRVVFKMRLAEHNIIKPPGSDIAISTLEYKGGSDVLTGCLVGNGSWKLRIGEMPLATFTGTALRHIPAENLTTPLIGTFAYGSGFNPITPNDDITYTKP